MPWNSEEMQYLHWKTVDTEKWKKRGYRPLARSWRGDAFTNTHVPGRSEEESGHLRSYSRRTKLIQQSLWSAMEQSDKPGQHVDSRKFDSWSEITSKNGLSRTRQRLQSFTQDSTKSH